MLMLQSIRWRNFILISRIMFVLISLVLGKLIDLLDGVDVFIMIKSSVISSLHFT